MKLDTDNLEQPDILTKLHWLGSDVLTASDLLHERWKAQSKEVSRRLSERVAFIGEACAELIRLRGEVERMRAAGQFLIDRVAAVEGYEMNDEDAGDFYGHVIPAIYRLKTALSAPTEGPRHD